MSERPYVLLKCAVSLDGYIGSAGSARLILSNNEDLDRVDAVRAGCDAILVGANTVRRDNPQLTVRSQALRDERVAAGLPPTPIKVTLSRSGALDRAANFFTNGDTEKLVYAATSAVKELRTRLGGVATVIDAGDPGSIAHLLADLRSRGIGRLLVEGGSGIHTAFLTAALADELQLVVAPLFVGDSEAPRFVNNGRFPWASTRRAQLADASRIGDVALLRYLLADPSAPSSG